jgi:hypothetical protein
MRETYVARVPFKTPVFARGPHPNIQEKNTSEYQEGTSWRDHF